MPMSDERRVPSWVCLQCKPLKQFYSKKEWEEHIEKEHPKEKADANTRS